LVPLMAHSPFGVSLSLRVAVGPFVMFHVLVAVSYFFSVVWVDIENIVRLIRLSLQMTFQVLLCPLWPPFPPKWSMLGFWC
jgi:hypothetical protein